MRTSLVLMRTSLNLRILAVVERFIEIVQLTNDVINLIDQILHSFNRKQTITKTISQLAKNIFNRTIRRTIRGAADDAVAELRLYQLVDYGTLVCVQVVP